MWAADGRQRVPSDVVRFQIRVDVEVLWHSTAFTLISDIYQGLKDENDETGSLPSDLEPDWAVRTAGEKSVDTHLLQEKHRYAFTRLLTPDMRSDYCKAKIVALLEPLLRQLLSQEFGTPQGVETLFPNEKWMDASASVMCFARTYAASLCAPITAQLVYSALISILWTRGNYETIWRVWDKVSFSVNLYLPFFTDTFLVLWWLLGRAQ